MNIDQLIAFERVVREGSFSRAAWSLDISQPTVSARIRALEQAVGGELFLRNNRQVTLTPRGTSFLPFARQALAALQAGIDAAARTQAGEQGQLTVGVLRSMTGSFLAPVLASFQRAYPAVECVMREGNHWQIVEWLEDGAVELGLITWPDLGPRLVKLVPLLEFHEPVVLLAPKSHPLTQLDTVTQDDIARLGDPFMLLRWWQVTPEPLAQLVRQAHHVADLPTDTARHLLALGLGVGFFTRTQIVPDLERGDAVELAVVDLPPIFRDSALVRPQRNVTLSAAAQHFVEAVQRQAKQLGLLL